MKMNKTISIDAELVTKLADLQLNVSNYCNEALWTYVSKVEHTSKQINETTEGLNTQMKELEAKKAVIDKREANKAKLKKANMTEDMLKFLNAMNTNISCAKDNMMAWERKFGSRLKYSELNKLKREWC